jgi:hypothetical protein
MGVRSERSNWSRGVGVSGSVQLRPADCRLADVMSRLGRVDGVDGKSSTTISGTSRTIDVVRVTRGMGGNENTLLSGRTPSLLSQSQQLLSIRCALQQGPHTVQINEVINEFVSSGSDD